MGSEWDVRILKSEIDREVKCVGLNMWKNGMERKSIQRERSANI